MAKQGGNLILHSRRLEHTEKGLAEVKALGVEAYAVSAELNDLDSVTAMLTEIDKLGMRVDIVLPVYRLRIVRSILIHRFLTIQKALRLILSLRL